jgi:3-oxoacyl-(acyl-carrier-protein) synthase III
MNTAILGTGSYLPHQVLTSAELGERLGIGEQWILDRTHIAQRRIAQPDEATSDLATAAARAALAGAGVDAADVDLIIVATSTPDQPMPATACVVQANLGAVNAAAFDVDAVCSGFIYALTTADALLRAREPESGVALVIGAETYSRVLNYADRRTCVLFGDGAGAVVLGRRFDDTGLLVSRINSDGRYAELVQVRGGGSRRPASAETIAAGQHYIEMRGRDVRQLAADVLPNLATDVLASAGLDMSDVDLFVPHQANGTMLADLGAKLGVRPGQMHLTVGRYGNTGAASIPITLDDAVRTGRLAVDDLVLLLAFGGGMTWGGAALRWSMPRRSGGRPVRDHDGVGVR